MSDAAAGLFRSRARLGSVRRASREERPWPRKPPRRSQPRRRPVKTHKNKASVVEFIAAVDDDAKRADAKAIDKMLREVTREKPAMWGPSIIGYGSYRSTNTTGEANWPKIGFSPRKGATVLYIAPGLLASDPLMRKLGKYKNGKSCLYIHKLADVDQKVLRELATRSWKHMSEKYG